MIAVIGDVHGCYFTLISLVEKIRSDYPQLNIYCVGDLVDRGNHSFEVFEYIISEKIVFTPGNHDFMFYEANRNSQSQMAKSWKYNGGKTTLPSYENNLDKLDKHLEHILNSPLFINTDDAFISHAGISIEYQDKINLDILDNDYELNKLLREDLYGNNSVIWARGKLLNIGKLQIVGHTHRREIYLDEDANALYIDTTAYGNNKLSAVIVNQNRLVEKIEQKTCTDDVNSRWSLWS